MTRRTLFKLLLAPVLAPLAKLFNRATPSRWQNFTGHYTSVSHDDLLIKMRKTLKDTKFCPPLKETTDA